MIKIRALLQMQAEACTRNRQPYRTSPVSGQRCQRQKIDVCKWYEGCSADVMEAGSSCLEAAAVSFELPWMDTRRPRFYTCREEVWQVLLCTYLGDFFH